MTHIRRSFTKVVRWNGLPAAAQKLTLCQENKNGHVQYMYMKVRRLAILYGKVSCVYIYPIRMLPPRVYFVRAYSIGVSIAAAILRYWYWEQCIIRRIGSVHWTRQQDQSVVIDFVEFSGFVWCTLKGPRRVFQPSIRSLGCFGVPCVS